MLGVNWASLHCRWCSRPPPCNLLQIASALAYLAVEGNRDVLKIVIGPHRHVGLTAVEAKMLMRNATLLKNV